MTHVPDRRRDLPSDVLADKLDVFARLPEGERRALRGLSEGRLRQIGAREDIIREGMVPAHVNLIVAGWACRYKLLANDRRQILAFLFPGDLCDPRVVVLQRMDHSIGTFMPTTFAEIPGEAILDLMDEWPRIARALWWSSLVAGAIEREWIVSLGQRTAVERLGHLFCEIVTRRRVAGTAAGLSCDMPLTQADLAEVCGLSAVHVNRSLQELRAQGLVDLRQKRLTILDFDRLAQRSLFTPGYLHLQGDGGSEN